jgi:hypothetical protein
MTKPFGGRALDEVLLEEVIGSDESAVGARAYNNLRRARISRASTLVAKSPPELMDIPGVGDGTLCYIVKVLFEHGLALSGEPWIMNKRGKMVPVSQVPLKCLNLSAAPSHLLAYWKVRAVGQLLAKSEAEIRERFSRLVAGRYANKYVDEIIRELARHCLRLAP